MTNLTIYAIGTLVLFAIGGFVVGRIKGSRLGTKLGMFTTAGLAIVLAGAWNSDGVAAKPESQAIYEATYQHYWLMSCYYYYSGKDRRTIIEAVASTKPNMPLDDHQAIKAAKSDADIKSCETAIATAKRILED